MILPEKSRKKEHENGALAKAPLNIKISAENLLYEIGEHILKTYDLL